MCPGVATAISALAVDLDRLAVGQHAVGRIVAVEAGVGARPDGVEASGAQPMIGAPVAAGSGRLAGLWSRWVWVQAIAASGRPPSAARIASTCSGKSGPGSITATSSSPTK